MKNDTILLIGAIGVGAYLLKDTFKGLADASGGLGEGVGKVGQAVGDVAESGGDFVVTVIDKATDFVEDPTGSKIFEFTRDQADAIEEKTSLDLASAIKLAYNINPLAGNPLKAIKSIWDFSTSLFSIKEDQGIKQEIDVTASSRSSSSGSGSSYHLDKPIVTSGSYKGAGLIPVGTSGKDFG